MGHISNPISNRLNYTSFWSSLWCSFIDKNYSYFLSEDYAIEDFLFWFFFSKKKNFFFFSDLMINRFFIYRTFNRFIIKIHFIPILSEGNNSINLFFKNLAKRLLLKKKILRLNYEKKEKFLREEHEKMLNSKRLKKIKISKLDKKIELPLSLNYSVKKIFYRFYTLSFFSKFLDKKKIKFSKSLFFYLSKKIFIKNYNILKGKKLIRNIKKNFKKEKYYFFLIRKKK